MNPLAFEFSKTRKFHKTEQDKKVCIANNSNLKITKKDSLKSIMTNKRNENEVIFLLLFFLHIGTIECMEKIIKTRMCVDS